jgi:hypothetical protein
MVRALLGSLLLALPPACAFDEHGLSHVSYVPPDGVFEDFARVATPALADRPDKGLDLRVARELGPNGYDKMRISVIGLNSSAPPPSGTVNFTYNEPFRYRWQGAYDLGRPATECGKAGVFSSTTVGNDADCLKLCSADALGCQFYTYFGGSTHLCQLASSCAFTPNASAEATYTKAGTHVLHSALVDVVPGQTNKMTVAGVDFSVRLPEQGAGTRGIVWSDPCWSGRWVGCQWGGAWDTFNRSVEMINTLAEDPTMDFWQILGDNFCTFVGVTLWSTPYSAFTSSFPLLRRHSPSLTPARIGF